MIADSALLYALRLPIIATQSFATGWKVRLQIGFYRHKLLPTNLFTIFFHLIVAFWKTIGKARDLLLEEEERKSGNPFYPEDAPVALEGPCASLEVCPALFCFFREIIFKLN